LASAAGRFIGRAAVSGSMSISASLTSTATRCPGTVSFFSFLKMPPTVLQPAISVAAMRRVVTRVN